MIHSCVHKLEGKTIFHYITKGLERIKLLKGLKLSNDQILLLYNQFKLILIFKSKLKWFSNNDSHPHRKEYECFFFFCQMIDSKQCNVMWEPL